MGDGSPLHQTYLAAYHEALFLLDPDSAMPVSSQALASLASSNDSFALMYLAIIHTLRGETQTAEQLRERGAVGCPGFSESPDFDLAVLREESPHR